MTKNHSKATKSDVLELRQRIANGQQYIESRLAQGKPVDKSAALLADLHDELAAIEAEQQAGNRVWSGQPNHPCSPGTTGVATQRRCWDRRCCPGCGTVHEGPWLDRSTIWCGLCWSEAMQESE